MTALPVNRDAVLAWGIRGSLLSYMSRDPDFDIATGGAATFTLEEGLRMPGRVDSAGVLRLEGSVMLRAHHGALIVPLVGVEVTAGALTIEDPADEPPRPDSDPEPADLARGRSPQRLPLVRLEAASRTAGGEMVFPTRLAAEADALFGYNYLPDTAFDPVRISFS